MAENWLSQNLKLLEGSLNLYANVLDIRHPTTLWERFSILGKKPFTLSNQQCVCSRYQRMPSFQTIEPIWSPLCVAPIICLMLGTNDLGYGTLVTTIQTFMSRPNDPKFCSKSCIDNEDWNMNCFHRFIETYKVVFLYLILYLSNLCLFLD